jgi:hypothetical protein
MITTILIIYVVLSILFLVLTKTNLLTYDKLGDTLAIFLLIFFMPIVAIALFYHFIFDRYI